MATTTISSPVTVVTNSSMVYARYLADLLANSNLTNVVGNENTLTITFDYSITIQE